MFDNQENFLCKNDILLSYNTKKPMLKCIDIENDIDGSTGVFQWLNGLPDIFRLKKKSFKSSGWIIDMEAREFPNKKDKERARILLRY